MRIGILGSGLMGGKLGTNFARAGHDVVFSYARRREKLQKLARDAGHNAKAGTPSEAAENADVPLLAVHWSRVDDLLNQAGDLSGKVIVTCSLPMNLRNTELVIAHTSSGAEALATKIPKARVVSAFNTIPSEVLFPVFKARRRNRHRKTILPWNEHYFRHRVAEVRKAAGIDPKGKFMGLRHGGNVEGANAGLTDAQLRALSGHRTTAALLRYAQTTKQQRRTAARMRLEARTKKGDLSE
jgi:predicted dinucleotide-binding enzyme